MTKEEYKIIWTLLQRVQLQGNEAIAVAQVMVKLSNLIQEGDEKQKVKVEGRAGQADTADTGPKKP